MYNSRLGLILMVATGDHRRVSVAIKNLTTFDDIDHVLMRGDADVTATYINTSPSTIGNMIITARIGGPADLTPGNYRYFITATYDTNKVRTWYWDVLVLPTDLSLLEGIDVSIEDYNPFVEEVTIYEGDTIAKELRLPGVDFTAVSGLMTHLGTDVTATYCSGAPAFDEDALTTHNIGGNATIPAGEYAYFLTGTYGDGDVKATWIYKITVVPKQGVL